MVEVRNHAWSFLPDLAPQLPVWFAGGTQLQDIKLRCDKCKEYVASEFLRGTVTRPIPTVANLTGWGYCPDPCACLTPFCMRVRGPNLTMEWQTPEGWVHQSMMGKKSLWSKLWPRARPKPAHLDATLESIPTEEARNLLRSPWLGVVEAELHGRGYRDLSPAPSQDTPGAIVLQGRHDSRVVIGTNAVSGDVGVPVGPVRISFPRPVDILVDDRYDWLKETWPS